MTAYFTDSMRDEFKKALEKAKWQNEKKADPIDAKEGHRKRATIRTMNRKRNSKASTRKRTRTNRPSSRE